MNYQSINKINNAAKETIDFISLHCEKEAFTHKEVEDLFFLLSDIFNESLDKNDTSSTTNMNI